MTPTWRSVPAICARLAAVLLSLACPSIVFAQAARIDTIVPAQAGPGDIVTITGNGFGARNVQIAVGGVPARVVNATGNWVSFAVPPRAPIGDTTVTATNPGGRRGSVRFHVLLGFTLDTSATANATVGVDGGTVKASSGGLAYTLSIPPGALDSDTSISVTPAQSIANLPFSNGIVAAAQFEPSGLHLHLPATLTIDLPASVAGTGLIGFLVGDDGSTFEAVHAQLSWLSLTIPVNHFTIGGAGHGTVADFAAQITPLLNQLPPTLPPSQVSMLIGIMVSWVDPRMFGFAVCEQTTLCQQVLEISLQSLQANEAAACAQANTFVNQHEPFFAYDQITSVVQIAARLYELATDADELNVSGFDPSFNLSCTGPTLNAIVDLAESQVVQRPRAGELDLISDIAADGTLLNLPDVQNHATSKLLDAVNNIIAQGDQRCTVDPDAGELLLNVVLDNFSDGFLNALSQGLAGTAHDAFAGCRIRITPTLPTVTVGQQIQFSGTAVGLTPPVTDLFWTIDPPALGSTIDFSTGLFTAGQFQGPVVVKAISVIRADLFKRTTVTIVPETCTPGPNAPAAPLARFAAPSAPGGGCNVQVSVTPSLTTVTPGGTVQFGATVTGSANTTVHWTAAGGTIDANGKFTAGTAPGTYSVRATSAADAGAFADAQVAVLGGSLQFGFRTIWLHAVPGCLRTPMAVLNPSAIVSASGGAIENQQSSGGLTLFDFHAPQAETTAILTATDPTHPAAIGVFATSVDPLINVFGSFGFGGNETGLWIIRGDDAQLGGPSDQYRVNYWNGQISAGISLLLKPNGRSFTGTDGVNSIDITISDSAADPNFGIPGFEVNGTAVFSLLPTTPIKIREVRFCR